MRDECGRGYRKIWSLQVGFYRHLEVMEEEEHKEEEVVQRWSETYSFQSKNEIGGSEIVTRPSYAISRSGTFYPRVSIPRLQNVQTEPTSFSISTKTRNWASIGYSNRQYRN
jgi:hypothetical protein